MPARLPEGTVTLLFTDLEGSTASANSLGEEAAQEMRQRHFATVREQLERNRGQEVKTMGDGFMVAFTSTRRAVQCAIEIQRAVEKERNLNPATPRVRIGLNAGEVVQDEEDLFGLMVNAAARIQAKAEGGQVLVSESVKMLLGPASGIEFKDVGAHELKGFQEPWRLFEVPYRLEGERTGPQGIFVGRETEMARLQARMATAMDGHGSVVAVVGEPGVGKTRLVREFGEDAARRGAQVHWGATHESAGAPAFWPWVRAIRSLNNAIDIEPLRPYIEERAMDLVRLFPEVRTIVPNLPEPAELPASDEESAQFRLFDATTGYLKRVAELHPLVIVLDDLHWADKPTLLLLQYIAAELEGARILIVGTYRDVEVGRQHPLEAALADLHRSERFEVVDLKGLNEAQVRDYIQRASGVEPSPDLVGEILEQTEGNPFFLGEVVALMAREGTLSAGGAMAIPQSVRAVVGQRLNKLSQECNEILRVAAVAGRQFRLDVLAEVSGQNDDAVLDRLEEAIDARVVDEADRPGAYQFHHALMQETLLAELSTTRRVRLHGRIADALERRYGERPERAAELAFHFGEAAAMSEAYAGQAVKYQRLAATHSAGQGAWSESVRLLDAALGLTEFAGDAELRASVLVDLAIAVQAIGDRRVAEVGRDALGAVEALDDSSLLVKYITAFGLWSARDRDHEITVIDRALASTSGSAPRLRGLLLGRGSRWRSDAKARQWLAEARELAASNDFPEIAALVAASTAGLGIADRGDLRAVHLVGTDRHRTIRSSRVFPRRALVIGWTAVSPLVAG